MQMDEIYSQQKQYFLLGETIDVTFRKNALRSLYASIEKYENEIQDGLYLDLGKSREESYMSEIGIVKMEISHMLKHIDTYARKHYVSTPVSQLPATSYTQAIPYGNVLIMSPWNYPFLLTIDPLVCSIAAGNTTIVKPSPDCPNTNHVIQKMLGEIFPEKFVAFIEGGVNEANALLEKKFDFVFFTGSTHTGKEVMQKCATFLCPVVLELGGKSPCIVEESADLSLSAKRIVFGKYLNCGQTCVAPDYVLIHRSQKEEFVQKVKEEIQKQYGEDSFHNTKYGKIINERHYKRIMHLIDESKVVYGGRGNPDSLQIEPTVMCDVRCEDAIMQEEIFGPVLPILEYDDFDEMVQALKQLPHPLALYLFSQKKEHIQKVEKELSYGGGCINDTIIHLASTSLGFGGVGESGMGSYHGKKGFDAFSHEKSIVNKKCWVDLPMRYAPYANALYNRIIRFFLK